MSDKQLNEGANPVAGLVDYQDGAVVSRTLLKKEKGTITVFSSVGSRSTITPTLESESRRRPL